MKKLKRALVLLSGLVLALALGLFAAHSPDPASTPFDPAAVPPFQGEAWVEINGNAPYFEESELTGESFERYSELDSLGRCGPALACVGRELMPTQEREGIGQYKPSGWQTARYDDLIEGKYLYNRCHLIGYQLTGENGETRNLITGTRFLNTKGMLPFENQVADYVRTTGNHVLYRVTPVFQEGELLARGVLMEAQSVEDGGEGVRFCVYAYNAQPGIAIDYQTGQSRRADEPAPPSPPPSPTAPVETDSAQSPPPSDPNGLVTYIANKNSLRFHTPDCPGVADMKEENKLVLTLTREEAVAQGYIPCKTCDP